MASHTHINGQARAVCNQADTLLDNLSRTSSLPTPLSLSIEELLENAWEIAYRQAAVSKPDNVIAFAPRQIDR